MQAIGEDDMGRTVEGALGQAVELRLPENRSAGFRWFLTSDGEPVCAIDRDEFRPPAQRTPGGRGEHLWQFRCARVGECRIELAYRRPWGETTPPERVFHFRIRVSS